MDLRIKIAIPAFCALIFSTAINAHGDHSPARTISVSGEGEVTVKPDRARLVMYVDKLTPDVKSGEIEVNKIVRTYVTEARMLGAKDEHLSTTGVSIQPEYLWDERSRQQKLAGYRVRREIAVLVNNLDQLADFILGATKSGVNQIDPPVLESSKQNEIERLALVEAAKAASSKAHLLAKTLNAKLGAVRSISAIAADIPRPMEMKVMQMRVEAGDANAVMGISLGEIRYRSEINAEFDLLPE